MVNFWKRLNKLFVNSFTWIEHNCSRQPWVFDIFPFGCKKVFFLCISGHWSLIKIWNLSHNYSDCKKETLKTKWVKNESQHWISAKISICINVFFFNPPYFQLSTFVISAIFSKWNWNISFRNIKMSRYRWTFPFD